VCTYVYLMIILRRNGRFQIGTRQNLPTVEKETLDVYSLQEMDGKVSVCSHKSFVSVYV
jgi:hypothetical protein